MALKMRVNSLLLSIGIALTPVYVFSSGGVQPAHMVLACFATLVLLGRGFPVTDWSILLFALFLHSFFVESIYAAMSGDPAFILNSIYFLYGFFISCAVYLHCRENGLSALIPGLLIACAIAVGTVFVSGVDLHELDERGRNAGSFNNPNQLGYFSVCLLSLTYLIYQNGLFKYSIAAGLFFVALFLSIASLSKAAMIANFLVIFLTLKPASSRNSIALWSLGTVGAAAAIVSLYLRGAFDDFLFMQRVVNMANEQDSSLEVRGYFAFKEGNLLQFIFGLGQQNVLEIVGGAVHSTLGSVFNTYGLTGFILFSGALAVWILRLWRAYGFISMFCLSAPVMLYGITHNGTRFTIFWLLFAASMGMAHHVKASNGVVRAKAPSGKVRWLG